MFTLLATVFLQAVATPSVTASRATPTCVAQWFEKGGPAPKKPRKPDKAATVEQRKAYQAAMIAYRPVAARYAAEAKAFGQKCILGNLPRWQPEQRAAAAKLVEAYVTQGTGFVTSPPEDIGEFCPGYASATLNQKTQFWRELFLAIIGVESDFNNASMMLDGEQYSIGLYQVSLHDGCAVSTELELTNPDKNTACAVNIMERLERPGLTSKGVPRNLIGGDGASLTAGAASYWSTLRASRSEQGVLLPGPRTSILSAVSGLNGCRRQ